MAVIQIEHTAVIPAPRRRVWEILVNHEEMPRWYPAREVIRRRAGEPDSNGVGAIRVVRMGGVVVEECITAFKPDERLEYNLTAGAPLRDYRGEVVLTAVSGGTAIRWSVNLTPRIPGTGWLARRLVARTLVRALDGLARRARAD
jgi:uncharacterized protein YndB with AHSA1/START domain